MSGGRGGDVYHVTNLNDSGPGSLRYGVESSGGPRTVVFDVSGTIRLESTLDFRRSNLTIAGETAPGQGVSVINYGINIRGSNTIVRHFRSRPGDAFKGAKSEGGFYGDAIQVKSSDVILDHVSTAWGIDETLSLSEEGTKRVTVQYSVISEGLDQTGLFHDEWNSFYNPGGGGHHSNGTLIFPRDTEAELTLHHNLWSNNYNRSPSISATEPALNHKLDVRNNVLHNTRVSGYTSGDDTQIDLNYVRNYIIRGPSSQGGWHFEANFQNDVNIYAAGNKYDGNLNGVLDGDFMTVVQGSYTALTDPVPMERVRYQNADTAYADVVAQVGAFFWNRDSVDLRLVNEVLTGQGQIIDSQNEVGGYPVLPALTRPVDWDLDADGMPNWWEERFEDLNPTLADNNGDWNGDGYTNLEEYLHFRASGAAVPEPSAVVLWALVGWVGIGSRRFSKYR